MYNMTIKRLEHLCIMCKNLESTISSKTNRQHLRKKNVGGYVGPIGTDALEIFMECKM